MKTKIIILPLLAVLLLAAGCNKKADNTVGQEAEGNSITLDYDENNSGDVKLPEIDMGNWKVLNATGFTITYPPYLKLTNKSSGKTVNVTFANEALNGQISSSEITSSQKFVLPVSKINIMLDKQTGGMEILDSGADLDRLVKASVASPSGGEYYFSFIFRKSEQDPDQVLVMTETVRLMLNSLRFK